METQGSKDEVQGTAESVRERILAAAARLIADGGREAATTRAVAAAASVQAPTIYRLFGDKQGLLEAVAQYGLTRYIAEKSALVPHPDPVQDLRDGWDMHMAFHLANPGIFEIMARDSLPPLSGAVEEGLAVLRRRIAAIARAGRLKMGAERALALLQSVGNGVVSTLLRLPEDQRDPGLSEAAREAVIAAISTEDQRAESGPRNAASMLRVGLDTVTVLSNGERHLLEELLDRISNEQRGLQ